MSKREENGDGEDKPRKRPLIQIKDSLVNLTGLLRIYRAKDFDGADNEIYKLVIVQMLGFEIETVFTWFGEEGEAERDREFAELQVKLEGLNYEIL